VPTTPKFPSPLPLSSCIHFPLSAAWQPGCLAAGWDGRSGVLQPLRRWLQLQQLASPQRNWRETVRWCVPVTLWA
jgi:hypothetical protein